MNVDRRRANLEKKIQGVEEEIDRQQKARSGIESLSKVYQETPDFCDEKGSEEVTRQLMEVCLSICLSVTSEMCACHNRLMCVRSS